jgi:hypothetical protein
MKRLTYSAAFGIAAALFLAPMAAQAAISATAGSGFASLDAANLGILYSARARGANSGWELGTGPGDAPSGSWDTAGFSWVDDADYDFEWTFSGGTSTLTIGSVSVSKSGLTAGNALYLQLRNRTSDVDDMLVKNLKLNDTSLSPDSIDLLNTESEISWLRIDGVSGALKVTGTLSGDLLTGNPSERMAFDIIGANVIPEPAAVLLGLMGLGMAHSLKRRV